MSELGVFAVDRGIFDHPLFDDGQSLSRREAWLWLLAEASWKARAKGMPGGTIRLARGQLSHSIRFLAAAWRWDKAKVERFLVRLKTEAMIETRTETGQTVVTICKYDEYQRVSLPTKTASETPTETAARQDRDKLEDIQGNQGRKAPNGALSESDVSDPAPMAKPSKRKVYPVDFEAAWGAYPTTKNMSKSEALPAWRKLSPKDRALVLPSIPGYVAHLKTMPDLETIHFCRYLSKRRFEGFAPVSSATATEADWRRRLMYARGRSVWSTAEWGPMPGQPGCCAPADLLLGGDVAGWQDKDASTSTGVRLRAGDPDAAIYRGVL